eukprot:9239642-Alexandrium_andersonii.AAC.1
MQQQQYQNVQYSTPKFHTLLQIAPKALKGMRCPQWPSPFVSRLKIQRHHLHARGSRAHARVAALGAEAPWTI